jgi:hypothetical protein
MMTSMIAILRSLYLLCLLTVVTGVWVSAQTEPEASTPPVTATDLADDTADDITDNASSTALAAPLARGDVPEQVADAAITRWQEQAQGFDIMAFASADASPAELCEELTALGQDPRIISSTAVNFDDRRLLENPGVDAAALGVEQVRRYSYPARVGEDTVARVEVLLSQQGDMWQSEGVRIRFDDSTLSLPGFLQSNFAGIAFLALTAYLITLLVRPSWFRKLLADGWQVIKTSKGLVIGTIVALYGVYTFGSILGTSLPECQVAIATFVGGSLDDIGIMQVLDNNNVAQTAAAITYWNFVQGTLTTTLFPAALLAIPAYLLNLSRFFVLGFALAPVGPQASMLLFHVPVIIIELLAYILVTAGGGIMLGTLAKQGFGSIRLAVRKLLLMVPIAFLLLVIGAWYESIEILWLLPAIMAP